MTLPSWCERTGLAKRKQKYRVRQPVHIAVYGMTDCNIFSLKGKLLATIDSNIITIYPGFCWDGATCAPDFVRVLRASLFHDLLCQLVVSSFYKAPHREDADDIFYDVAMDDKFKLAGLYKFGLDLYRKYLYPFLPHKSRLIVQRCD